MLALPPAIASHRPERADDHLVLYIFPMKSPPSHVFAGRERRKHVPGEKGAKKPFQPRGRAMVWPARMRRSRCVCIYKLAQKELSRTPLASAIMQKRYSWPSRRGILYPSFCEYQKDERNLENVGTAILLRMNFYSRFWKITAWRILSLRRCFSATNSYVVHGNSCAEMAALCSLTRKQCSLTCAA